MGKNQGEKLPMSDTISLSNEQWNDKVRGLESEKGILQKKIDERDTALKNISNVLTQLGKGSTQLSATLNNVSDQIMQMLQPPQENLPPNNKAN